MTVYHPRSWLRQMPKFPRFYKSKDDVRTEHPGIADSEIVTASYSGTVDETTIVFNARPPIAAQGVATLEERAVSDSKTASDTVGLPVDQATPTTPRKVTRKAK